MNPIVDQSWRESDPHHPFDLAIIGGGAYGIALALEAARRQLRPILVEAGDFAGATTANSLRIVHGGLRYLQSLDLRRHRVSVRERNWFLCHFPDLVEPLKCMMPLFGGLKRPSVVRAALALNDLLCGRIEKDQRLPPGQVWSATDVKDVFPLVRPGLLGGAVWHDAIIRQPQRLWIEMLRWACASGATVVNYAEAQSMEVRDGSVAALHVRDLRDDVDQRIATKSIVNCAGPWCDQVAAGLGLPLSISSPSLAFNVLLDRPWSHDMALAVAAPAPKSPMRFVLPWRGRLLAGTVHAVAQRVGEEPSPEQVSQFLDELNQALPGLAASPDHVIRVYSGTLPASRPGTSQLRRWETIVDHQQQGGPRGLFSVSGVKLTTSRYVAERLLCRIAASNHFVLKEPNGTRPAPQIGIDFESGDDFLKRPEPQLCAEIRRIAHEESVVTEDDFLFRRTNWGADARLTSTFQQALRGVLSAATENPKNPRQASPRDE